MASDCIAAPAWNFKRCGFVARFGFVCIGLLGWRRGEAARCDGSGFGVALSFRLRRLPRMDVVVRRSRRRSVVGGVCVLGWLAS